VYISIVRSMEVECHVLKPADDVTRRAFPLLDEAQYKAIRVQMLSSPLKPSVHCIP
jgi:hypothetical protein